MSLSSDDDANASTSNKVPSSSQSQNQSSSNAPAKPKRGRPSQSQRAKRGKNKKKRNYSYNIYIYRVLKQVHPDRGITKKAMSILNSFMEDIFFKICSEAQLLCLYNKKRTLNNRQIKSAVSLCFPGEFAKHAHGEGHKACTKYADYINNKESFSGNRNKRGKEKRDQIVTMQKKTGLEMPVTRIKNKMKANNYAPNVGILGAVYLTAVMEYCIAELLELSGEASKDRRKKTITPRDIYVAIKNDDELNKIVGRDLVIPKSGNCLPFIHGVLLPKDKKKKAKKVYEAA